MVDLSDGQFYTMEGIAAAVLMVLTAYLVMSTTTIYTPGDSHIIDMQLEQVGNDALKVMDTKINVSADNSLLEGYLKNNNKSGFVSTFDDLINHDVGVNRIQFKADIFYINATGNIKSTEFATSSRHFTGNENAIRVSRWVFLYKPLGSPFENRNQTVLLEVLLWRN